MVDLYTGKHSEDEQLFKSMISDQSPIFMVFIKFAPIYEALFEKIFVLKAIIVFFDAVEAAVNQGRIRGS